MRIIYWLALGLGVAAIATAAPARPATGSFGSVSPQAGGPKSGGHHWGQSGRFRFGPGTWKGDRRPGRHGHPGRFGRRGWGGYDSYGGIAGPVGAVDPHGNGFFAGAGGRIDQRGGRPYYDYDRAYPYEWSSAAGGRGRAEDEALAVERPPARCTMESGVRVCRGW